VHQRLHCGEYRQDPRAEASLVPTLFDLQVNIAAELIRRRLDVHAFYQRSVAGMVLSVIITRQSSTRLTPETIGKHKTLEHIVVPPGHQPGGRNDI
jgi:hypothetical protein